MSLFKRHFGRRVTVVGVGVALLVLGLEAPAFAVTPTVDSFSPASGPVGCVVVVTGTNFTNPAVTEVRFNGATGTIAPDFAVQTDTELWVTVPAGAANGPIAVTNASGTGTSAAGFTVSPATSPGGCAPTITSFTPECASPGATVTITGTNLLVSADPATTQTPVRFAPHATAADALHTIPNAETPTTLSVIVPSGTTDGPIRVTTFATTGGTIFSTTQFTTPPPDCPEVGGNVHARSITLSLRKHLVARGRVSSTEDPAFTDCVAGVPVKIQRRRAGGWRTVGSTTTSDTGGYKKRIKDRPGKYRALAPKVTLGDPVTDTCSRAVSPRRTHRH
jgi:hypothetical protein